MSDELAAAVDEVLGGWEVALETRGAILPHNLKAWEQVEDYLTVQEHRYGHDRSGGAGVKEYPMSDKEKIARLEAENARLRAQIKGAHRSLASTCSWGKKGLVPGVENPAYDTMLQGAGTTFKWLDGVHPALPPLAA
jgi:hypothetical protein